MLEGENNFLSPKGEENEEIGERENVEAEEPIKSETPEVPKTTKDSKGVFEKASEFQRSRVGKIVRWITLAGGIFAAVYAYDYIQGKRTKNQAWQEFKTRHSEVAESKYDNLDEVPESDRDTVAFERNYQYQLRISEAIENYKIQNPNSGDLGLVEKKLREFNLGDYEKALEEFGLGSRVYLRFPLPVIRFFKAGWSEAGIGGVGETKFASQESEPDTIFIDPESANVTETIQHEYLHTLQKGEIFSKGENKEGSIYANEVSEINPASRAGIQEGQNELLRLRINKKTGQLEIPTSDYFGETFAAFLTENIIGQEKFWEIFKEGKVDEFVKEIDGKYGEGTFRLIFGYDGLSGLVNEHAFSANQAVAFDALSKSGVLTQERIDAFKTEFGFDLGDLSRPIIRDSEGNPIGVIKSFNGKTFASFVNPQSEMMLSFTNDPDVLKKFPNFESIDGFPKNRSGHSAIEDYFQAETPEQLESAKAEIAEFIKNHILESSIDSIPK